MKILIVEDEKELCESISSGLKLDGYDTEMSFDGEDALDKMYAEIYDLILLDLNLPYIDGIEVLREFRKENRDTPVLILSARTGLPDKITGLDEGANDYLTKPFHFEELEARIRSLTRRKFVQESNDLEYGDLVFDGKTRKVYVKKEEVHLTRKETGILEYLLINRGRVVSQEEIIEHIWDSNANELSGSIRVHISSLRKKMKESLGYDPIVNMVGQGYIFGGNE